MITKLDYEEYLSRLKEIQQSVEPQMRMINPQSQPTIFINANTRSIEIPNELKNVAVTTDHKAETVYFQIDRFFDDVDFLDDLQKNNKTCVVQYINAKNQSYYYPVTQIYANPDDETKIYFAWTITGNATPAAGKLQFAVRIFNIEQIPNALTGQGQNKLLYNFNTRIAEMNIIKGMNIFEVPDELDPTISHLEKLAFNAKKDIEHLRDNSLQQITQMYEQDTRKFTQVYETNTTAFNANAEEKTNAFDTNAETRTVNFNNNASEKTMAFNNNATSKTTTFNNNATNKTKDFNSNAQQKTADFNSFVENTEGRISNNFESKIERLDSHSEVILNGFNTKANQIINNLNNQYEDQSDNLTAVMNDGITKLNQARDENITTFNENAATKTQESIDAITNQEQLSVENIQNSVVNYLINNDRDDSALNAAFEQMIQNYIDQFGLTINWSE